jgi:hypothetical protein
MINGIMRHAENHRLIFIKLGSSNLIKTQESSYTQNWIDFPYAKPGTYLPQDGTSL